MARIDLDAHLLELWDRERERCAADPCYWVKNYGITKDEHDKKNPVKLIPDHAYLRFVLNEWHTGEKVQFVAKSRQLMVSWLLALYSVWTAKFAPHRLVLFQSKKFEDACKMVALKFPDQARCTFIEKHQPAFLKGCLGSKGEWLPLKLEDCMTEGRLVYPNGSAIEAIPQGPAQIEGRVPSLFCNDEASLQEEWRAGHAAAIPCVMGTTEEETAHYITVATMRLPSAYGEEIAGAGFCDPDEIMRGVGRFKSLSGIPVLRIHYSADPGKDPANEEGRKWLARVLLGYRDGANDVDFRQHYEIDPFVQSGRMVIPDWDSIKRRVVIDPFPVEAMQGWHASSGLDWGASNRTVWQVWANDFQGNRYCVEEIAIPANSCGGVRGYAALMKASPWFEKVNGTIQADPSIFNVTQSQKVGGMVSNAQLFAQEGVFLQPAKAKGQAADEILKNRLLGDYWPGAGSEDFEPSLFIFSTCENLIRTIPIWRYEEWSPNAAGDHALKEKMRDFEVDSWDSWKYCEMAQSAPGRAARNAPRGSFDWLRAMILRQNTAQRYARS